MDTIMLTGLGAIGTTAFKSYDFKKKKVNKTPIHRALMTTVATAATAVTGACINNYTKEQIHQKYASAYVESMSDEELERALVEMDLLVAASETEEVTKTI